MIEINITNLEKVRTKGAKDKKKRKQRSGHDGKNSTGILAFDSYAEALEYIDTQAKKYSNKNEFYASDEYKELYPVLKEVHKRENTEWSKSAEKAMESAGVKYGDNVQYTNVGSFMSSESYSGVIVDRKGIPYVKLDPGQSTVDNKKSIRWHKGWKK